MNFTSSASAVFMPRSSNAFRATSLALQDRWEARSFAPRMTRPPVVGALESAPSNFNRMPCVTHGPRELARRWSGARLDSTPVPFVAKVAALPVLAFVAKSQRGAGEFPEQYARARRRPNLPKSCPDVAPREIGDVPAGLSDSTT
jgi:hypothetical protein